MFYEFFELKGDDRITERCATEHCEGQPTWRLESGGVGSNYCSGCKEEIVRMFTSRSEKHQD